MSPVARARASPPRSTRMSQRALRRKPPAASMAISEGWPKTSAISERSRRATDPVSSSASTTTRPFARCSPPAKRRITAISARRQQAFPIGSRLSSSFTVGVMAATHGLLLCLLRHHISVFAGRVGHGEGKCEPESLCEGYRVMKRLPAHGGGKQEQLPPEQVRSLSHCIRIRHYSWIRNHHIQTQLRDQTSQF